MADTQLQTYLDDHLAAAVGILELARRCRRRNDEGPLSVVLDEVLTGLHEERGVVERALAKLGGVPSRVKNGGAWLVEKVGRLKLNGSLFSYTDLARIEELEAIIVGEHGKRALWRTLAGLQRVDSRLEEFDFVRMEEQTDHRIELLEAQRMLAAAHAFHAEAEAPVGAER